MDLATLVIAALGVACIYAGYRLFCGLPALKHSGGSAVFLMNVVPGALLALLGTFLVTTQAVAMVSHRSAIQRHQAPATEGTSWHPGVIDRGQVGLKPSAS